MKTSRLTLLAGIAFMLCSYLLHTKLMKRQETFSTHLQEVVVAVNSNPDSTWNAQYYEKWRNSTLDDLRRYFNASAEAPGLKLKVKTEWTLSDEEVPASLDLRKLYPGCRTLLTILD